MISALSLRGLAGTLAIISPLVWAHGFITEPPSRGYSCNIGQNVGCGDVQYEPQSLEAPTGFPNSGPADGKIGSAGAARFGQLDEQTAVRWKKTSIKPGDNTITWKFTAAHPVNNWRYYMTKQDWDPNQPLTRASFDLTPFCKIDGKMALPQTITSKTCNVPNRTGYQVILAVWEVADTPNSFYNLIDVDFAGGSDTGGGGGGSNTPAVIDTWAKEVGNIQPLVDLKRGDSVKLRVFDSRGERSDLSIPYTIESDESGAKNVWAHDFADKINTSQQLVRAGQKEGSDIFNSVYGNNTVYATEASGINHTEIQIDQQPVPVTSSITVTGVEQSYTTKQSGDLTLAFNVSVNGKLTVETSVYDSAHVQKVYESTEMNNDNKSFSLAMKGLASGNYGLLVVGKDENGNVQQQIVKFTVTVPSSSSGGGSTNYDAVFPEKITTYKGGTKVLQPKDGKVYQCKPAPYSGFCKQWSATATGFEPGVGASWEMAWTLVK
ncbi:N-acetylglucosamine-binding protein GbpA [Budviciaceae bacterium BWR-B9]|uniref:N-acetylglucosamine-binding protein GbpA n=1 Tax=Limnobaculum allomyrinae TaxID=2791986 RepID=A0ABS1IQG1_9GAMM|nr:MULTISPECIES: N-acetylglucosamine-binding protein GbpA [Limnobaculum]MBK5144000.1 N-acetylglucosamine-binding protein GbpA [Limnobaculum allomyrinae]MBV7691659.1 N-acetylglucosamine-binding protein GbpA [Limnobaculum sp. M2-1]